MQGVIIFEDDHLSVPPELHDKFTELVGHLRNVSGGLAAASFVVVTQVCTRDSLDWWLKSSVFIFAFTIPFLVGFWMKPLVYFAAGILQPNSGLDSHPKVKKQFLMSLGVKIVNWLGFVLFFGHFGWLCSMIFAVATVIVWRRGCGQAEAILRS